MKKIFYIITAMLLLLTLSFAFACGGGNDDNKDNENTIEKYKVIYDQDGTTFDKTVEVEVGKLPLEDVIPTLEYKKGYTASWEQVDLSQAKANETLKVKAVYTPKTYTVSYADSAKKTTVTFGKEFTLEQFSKTGYEFDGFYYVEEGKTVSVAGLGESWSIDKDVTLTPSFSVKVIQITYMDGTNKLGTQTVNYGDAYTLRTFSKQNETFDKWVIMVSGAEVDFAISGTAWEYEDDVTVYAKWVVKQTYSVRFLQGSLVPVVVNVIEGNSVSTEDIPQIIETRTGYVAEWRNNESVVDFSNITGSVDLTPYYNPKTYTIKFNVNGGNAVSDMVVRYNEAYTLVGAEKANLSFKEYRYDGSAVALHGEHWTIDTDNVEGIITLEAVYQVKVTFVQKGFADVVRYFAIGHTVTNAEIPATQTSPDGKLYFWKNVKSLTNLQSNKTITCDVVDPEWTENV